MMKPTIKTAFAAVLTAGAVVALSLTSAPAQAAGAGPKPAVQDWTFKGLFGTYDRASAQRGYKVYKEVCSACHSMNLIKFRNLQDIGFSEAQTKALAAEYEIQDGPNDDGDMFARKRTPSDPLPSPFANDKAAAAANNGATPPDLSLITKARHGGVDYNYGVMIGYEPPPAGMQVPPGMNYNKYFPGHMIAMPPPLSEGTVTYADGTPATVPQMARDVTTFLAWAAEPEMETRKRLGLKVLAYLLLMAGVLYAYKRKVWAAVH